MAEKIPDQTIPVVATAANAIDGGIPGIPMHIPYDNLPDVTHVPLDPSMPTYLKIVGSGHRARKITTNCFPKEGWSGIVHLVNDATGTLADKVHATNKVTARNFGYVINKAWLTAKEVSKSAADLKQKMANMQTSVAGIPEAVLALEGIKKIEAKADQNSADIESLQEQMLEMEERLAHIEDLLQQDAS